MSQTDDDDRATKAARAKALLKKRQQQKTGVRSAPLASPPPSRSYTPVLVEPTTLTEETKRERDINDLFSPNDTDANWIESLPRAEVPNVNTIAQPQPRPSPKSPPPLHGPVGSPPPASQPVTAPLSNQRALNDLQHQVAEQRQVIASLQTENAAIQTSLTHLDKIQADARENAKVLQEERARCKALEDDLARAMDARAVATRHVEELSREKSRLESLHSVAQTKIGSLEGSRLDLDQRLGEAGKKVGSLQRDVERLTSDLRVAQQQVHDSRAHSTKVEQELSAARSQIEELHGNAVANSKRWQEQDQNRQQTISLLVSEKASLIASVQRLEEVEIELQENEKSLVAEEAKTARLTKRVQELEVTATNQGNELQVALSRERELSERTRDQDREIQLRKAELEEVQATSNQHQQRVRELEEQIESDDRADKLEVSLKNTQDRAEELEFQLNKIQQSHTTVKHERDNLESQLRSKTESEMDWKTRHATLEADHAALQGHLQSANDRHDTLLEERASLLSQVEFNQSAVKQLQQKLGELASEVTSSDRALQNVQGELRAALRRAEESEKTQKDLQAEGTQLMASLDEMRPKIVELTSVKLELMEQIEGLEHGKRSRDALISKLEVALNEGTEREAEAAKLHKESDTLRDKDNRSLQQGVADLQHGYTLLEAELASAQATIKSFETERTRMRQTEVQHADISHRMSADARRREQDVAQLESALASARKNEAEQSQLLHHYRTEIEALQSELALKDQEELDPRTPAGLRSLDDEMLSAVRQQHTIELSSAQSQMRALESAAFEAQDRAHRLQRQVHVLEDQLAVRSVSRASSRPFSPAAKSGSRTSGETRRASVGKSGLVPPTRSVFDVGLSPETRHKRQVSLTMLKARIESETHRQTPPLRGLSPVPDSALDTDSLSHRAQFMDESHIFWCHACRGELVIL